MHAYEIYSVLFLFCIFFLFQMSKVSNAHVFYSQWASLLTHLLRDNADDDRNWSEQKLRDQFLYALYIYIRAICV